MLYNINQIVNEIGMWSRALIAVPTGTAHSALPTLLHNREHS